MNVTLYIQKDQSEVWERARKLAKDKSSLSAMVTEALKEYVEREETRRKAQQELEGKMREYELEICRAMRGPSYTIRFRGVLLAREPGIYRRDIYLTDNGNLVLYWNMPNYTDYRKFNSFEDLVEWFQEKQHEHEDAGIEELLAEAANALGEELVIDL